ncbi:MAG: hypothetical protein ABFD50_05425 [Smithella sp.]
METDITVSALTDPNQGSDPIAIISSGVLCAYYRKGDAIVQWVRNNPHSRELSAGPMRLFMIHARLPWALTVMLFTGGMIMTGIS